MTFGAFRADVGLLEQWKISGVPRVVGVSGAVKVHAFDEHLIDGLFVATQHSEEEGEAVGFFEDHSIGLLNGQ
jgi:hypothetical protein